MSLTIAGTVASSAAPSERVAASGSSSVIPNATAPHVGHVAGVQYGPHISLNNHQSVHAFKTLHNQMLGTGHTSKADIDTIHEYVGTSFNQSTVGSQATQSVSTKIHAGPEHAGALHPHHVPIGWQHPRLVHRDQHGLLPGSDAVAAWDWCHAITFVAQKTINKSFMKTYTKKKYYSQQILADQGVEQHLDRLPLQLQDRQVGELLLADGTWQVGMPRDGTSTSSTPRSRATDRATPVTTSTASGRGQGHQGRCGRQPGHRRPDQRGRRLRRPAVGVRLRQPDLPHDHARSPTGRPIGLSQLAHR